MPETRADEFREQMANRLSEYNGLRIPSGWTTSTDPFNISSPSGMGRFVAK